MAQGQRIVAAARAMIGTPFRLQGRSRETGVDCIGLVLMVLREVGQCRTICSPPTRYSIRGGTPALFEQGMLRAGLRPVGEGDAEPGDFVLVRAGVAQFHLMIATDDGHVHAHAGLGRVVEMPGVSPWPVLGRWRLGAP